MTETRILQLDRAQFSVAPWTWPFAQARRGEIDAHFSARRVRTPELWNGRVLLLRAFAFEGASLRGTFFETDFASFLAWRDWDLPDAGAFNCFAMGAIRSADGAYLLGVMGAHTANAGRVYFPAGTPDPDDIVGAGVDLDGSVLREVTEETGLTADDFDVQAGWTAVITGPRVALMKRLGAREPAAELRRRMLAHLKREAKPELSDIRIVASRADFDPNMPPFVTAFLAHEWPE
jgi:8-oxo-dGTP pyrophosphatase MutT (NUDIX family)